MTLPEPPRCVFPSCLEWARHDHHVTYDPPVTKGLCVRHHEEITIVNGQQARKYRRSLSNNHRWWIWFQWIEGKLKARRTRKALEYTEEWAAGTLRRVGVVNETKSSEDEIVSPPTPVRKNKKRKHRKTPIPKPKRRNAKAKQSSQKKSSRRN